MQHLDSCQAGEASEKKVHRGSALSAALKAPCQQPLHDSRAARAASQQQRDAVVAGAAAVAAAVRRTSNSALTLHSASSASSSSVARLPRVMLPFLSCLTGAAGAADAWEGARRSAVMAAEVGIRPSFYWLDLEVSEEERLVAENQSRWMKNDCQDDALVVHSFAGLSCQIFAGVFDGHGPFGRSAAKYASTLIPRLLAASPAMASRGGDKKRRLRAMREACAAVDTDMRDATRCGFDASLSGTTACFAVVCGKKVFLANTGDSRCVLARRRPSGGVEAVQLTWDAKPDHPDELRRISNSGGVVQQLLDESGERVGAHRVFRQGDDVLPGLAMSRSLGDLYAHAVGVTPEPVLATYTLGERDLFLVLGTDGLWDIMNNEDVVDFIERYRNGRVVGLSCAEALTLEAQERWKARHEEALVDDISVAIIHTTPLPPVNRSACVRSPLAHAASCNDEANDLFRSWAQDVASNPSYHAPQHHFQHLYPPGADPIAQGLGERSSGSAAGAVAAAPSPASGRSVSLDTAPAGPAQAGVVQPLRRLWSEGAALAAEREHGLLPPRAPPAAQPSPCCGSGGEGPLATPPAAPGVGPSLHISRSATQPFRAASPLLTPSPVSGAGLYRLAAAQDEELSPRSSLDYSDGESLHYSIANGSRFNGAFARSPAVPQPVQLGSIRSMPIPCRPAEVDPLLRPIRKAYPSQGGQLCSFASDASILNMQQEDNTPRSTETSRSSAHNQHFGYEGKLRGGLPRTTSAPILAQSLRWSQSLENTLSSSMHTMSLDDRTLGRGQLASCALSDSPTDSTLSSPYRLRQYSTLSPMGPPMVGSAPGPPCVAAPAFPFRGGGRSLVRSVSEAAAEVGRQMSLED